jgi:hypothetical protein
MTLGAIALLVSCDDEHRVIDVYGDVPDVPLGVNSITGDRQVEVYWQANNDNGLTRGYGVYRYTRTVNEVDEYELLGTVSASSDIEVYSYFDRNLANGVKQWYAVNAYNDYGESELSWEDIHDTPRPRGSTEFNLGSTATGKLGFDLSTHKVVGSNHADIVVEFDVDLQQYFIDVGNSSTLLQDYGYIEDLGAIGWGDPGGGWSELGWAELLVGHGYLVYTSDNHYAAIWISSIDYADKIVYADWAYQTDTGNPELKRAVVTRPQHDATYGKRKG